MKEEDKTEEPLIQKTRETHARNPGRKKSTSGGKAAMSAAREADLYAESIVNAVQEPFVVLDKDLKVSAANRSFYSAFHITPDATLGTCIYDLGNGQWDIPGLRVLLEKTLSVREAVGDCEVAHNFPDIGRKILLLNARRIYRKDSGSPIILLAIEDRTACSQREHAFKEAECRGATATLFTGENTVRAVTDAATDAIVFLDNEGRILYGNPAAMSMLGYRCDELIGRNVTILIPPRYRAAHEKLVRDFVETGRGAMPGRTYEASALRKDGAEVPVELSLSGVRLNGKWHSVGIARDITERRLLEGQFRHSQKMEGIGRLAGGIAHDFNNILTAIIGYSNILHMKMKENDPLRQLVEHILESSDRAADLTQSLLAFSRKQEINPKPLNINEALQRVGKFLRRIIGEDIDLKMLFRPDAAIVKADSGQIEQVLMNLATNARDAMPHGGSFTIETDTMVFDEAFIHAHGWGEPAAYAVITVTDTGTGMDEATRKRIFEPYFTTKETGKGTGLGLSMAFGIVKQHNGYIDVYSEPGQGSTFRIYLPLINSERENAGLPAAAAAKELPRGTETILVAEDNETLRKMNQTILEGSGYKVILAEDGEAAVRKFAEYKNEIRIAVLDMIMPRKNGKEAYEEINRIRPDTKVIFVSGYPLDKMHAEGSLDKGSEHIQKPVTPSVLLTRVRAILDS